VKNEAVEAMAMALAVMCLVLDRSRTGLWSTEEAVYRSILFI
jgi:hypothetical protein